MDSNNLLASALAVLPPLLAFILVAVVLAVANWLLRRNQAGEMSVSRQLLMLCVTAAGVLFVIFSLPLSETSRGQILSLLGIVITAVIALSSTTFVANIMAGLMLRAVNSFQPGDFIRCDNYFGRVTVRGIFHTEIQTEDMDLATVPNMYLVTNPVTVVQRSGTIISASLSLGYDISCAQIETLLKQAADATGLQETFVLVGELGDFSVSYRVAGFSEDVSRLLSTRSNLRKNIIAVLHDNGIEIVSPNFMNQRVLQEGEKMIAVQPATDVVAPTDSAPEEVIFAKADDAEAHEALKQELITSKKQLSATEAPLSEAQKSALEQRVEQVESILSDRKDQEKRD